MTTPHDQFIIDRIHALWPEPRKCPLCNRNGPWLTECVFELREFHGGAFGVGGGVVMPVVSVTCKTCSGVQLFNAIALGVVDQKTGALLDQ